MRITNKVMQNNALSNINRNKVLQDDLNSQISTGKKISRPSDDPVVAIRALRLRSDVSQVNQYYEKNIPDAQAWLSLTEGALKTTIDVIKSTVSECEKGASDHLQTSDRNKIIDSLKALRDEVYNSGDADYAGRYIFTGYRTDTPLTFGSSADLKRSYEITQTFSFGDCEVMSYVDNSNLDTINEANYTTNTISETDIDTMTYYRFRLAYDELDAVSAELFKRPNEDDPDAKAPFIAALANIAVETDPAVAYAAVAAEGATNKAYLIPSTGELVMSKDVYDAINALPENEKNLNITYTKSSWQSKDLRPEHYFYCRADNEKGVADPDDPTKLQKVDYNPDYRFNLAKSPDQRIEYQVGYEQSVQVNTYASDVYKHDISRDVDEIIKLAETVTKAEAAVARFEGMQNNADYDQEIVERDLAAAKKNETYLKDQLQKYFSKYITKSQGYLNDANEAITQTGNRDKRVSLAENRLSDQQTTFKTLASDNEDADATEVAVQLSSAEVSYEAALMATSKMIQSTLLNYL